MFPTSNKTWFSPGFTVISGSLSPIIRDNSTKLFPGIIKSVLVWGPFSREIWRWDSRWLSVATALIDELLKMKLTPVKVGRLYWVATAKTVSLIISLNVLPEILNDASVEISGKCG